MQPKSSCKDEVCFQLSLKINYMFNSVMRRPKMFKISPLLRKGLSEECTTLKKINNLCKCYRLLRYNILVQLNILFCKERNHFFRRKMK